MLRLVVARLAALIGVMFAVSLLVFLMTPLLPGDPVRSIIGDNGTPEQYAQVKAELGLDKSLPVQYETWLGHLVRGDLSTSYFSSEPVTELLAQGARVTLALAFGAIIISSFFGIGIGMVASLRPRGVMDRLTSLMASVGLAAPNFWVAMLLALAFAVVLSWFPATGFVPISEGLGGWAKSLALPVAALALRPIALIARMTRASMLSVLNADYIRTAIARGIPRRRIIFRHALRNALVPVVTVIGVQASILISTTVVVEKVFALPGLGNVAISAVVEQDIPVLQGFVLLVAFATVLSGLLIDLSTAWLNPRVRIS